MVVSPAATSARVEGLINGVTYYFAVTAVNLAGSQNTAVQSISATPAFDSIPPLIADIRFDGSPLTNGSLITRSGQISLTATDLSGISRVEFIADGQVIATDSNGSTTYSALWDITTITDGPHALVVNAFDTLGNKATVTLSVTVALAPPPAPIILQPVSGLVTNQAQVTVSGTAEKGSQVLLYRNGTQVAGPIGLDAANTFSAVITLVEGANDLQAAAQNRGGQGPLSAAVRVTLDTNIPPAPANLFAQAREAGVVRLTWTAVNDQDVIGYDVYRASAPFTAIGSAVKVNPTPLQTTVFDDLPGFDGLYYYRVVSVNTARTSSAPSNQVSVTADATAPRATSIAYVPQGAYDAGTGRMGPGRVDVVVQVSEALLASPFLTLTPAAGVPIAVQLIQTGETAYQGHFDIASTTPSGTAYAVFSARDKVGNRGTDIDVGGSILIDTTGPIVTGLTVTPSDPIRNDPDPATVHVSLELDTVPAGSGTPELSYLLSAVGRQSQAITLSQTGERAWSGTFTLPADAGAPVPEVLEFGFRAVDDLGNVTDTIQGGNRFQVYQGDLPPLDVPTGLLAKAMPGGEVHLKWNAVYGAADYQLFRAAPGEGELTAYQRTAGALEFTDSTTVDGSYRYAVASVRQANGQEGISAHGPVVEVYADATPPEAPANLTLELTGYGIRSVWQAPADEPVLTYRLYRDAAEILDIEGLSPVLSDIVETSAIDGAPSETAHHYVVTAVDPAGNESVPSSSAYLNFDLLPVANLTVVQQDEGLPDITWSASGTTVAGYNIYLLQGSQSLKLNPALLPEPRYTDTGYTGEERQYAVAAVDDHAVEGPRRQVLLPRISAVASGAPVKRGIMNRLDYQVRNDSTQALSEIRLQTQIGQHVQRSLPFSLDAGAARTVSAIVGGFDDLPDFADLVTTLEVTAPTGEQTRIVRTSGIAVSDDALALDILTEAFTRGGTGQVRFSLNNTSDVEIEIVTATSAGDAQSDQVRFLLMDQDGNVLGTQAIRQALGEGVLTLPNGKTVARIAAGAGFTSAPVDIQVPLSTPEQAVVQLEIDQIHYHLGQEDQVSIPGFNARRAVSLVDVSYSGEITSITPTASFGDQDILITGRALARGTSSPMPQVLLKLVLVVNGFERGFDVATDATGNFSFTFVPLPGESGIYQVSAVHPDLLERPAQGQFTIGRVIANPNAVNLRMPVGHDQAIPIQLTAGAGTTATDVRLVFEAADQPLGALPEGIALILPDPISLTANQSAALTFGVHADDIAAQTGTFVVAVKSQESGNQVLAKIRVDYSLSEATPALYFTPSFIETGVALSDSVTEQVTLENRGLATLEGVKLALLMPDGSPAPAWAFLSSAADQGNLAVGETRPVNVTVSPTAQVAEGIYEFILRVTSGNASPVDIHVYASVTQSGIGSALFHVSDIYTATIDKDGNLVQGLAGAEVRLQNEAVLTVEQTLTTDAHGEALFLDLPAGHYKFRARAANHQEVIGRLWIKPGITQSQEVFLDYNLVTVEWSVTEVPLQDRYEIILNATYETDVPAPVVVIEPGSINLPEMQVGDVYYGEFTLTNYGLIRADDLTFSLPQDDAFKIELLSGLPTSLDAKQRVTIPYRVTALKSLTLDADGGAGGDCQLRVMTVLVTYVYQCSNGTTRSGTATQNWIYVEGECTGVKAVLSAIASIFVGGEASGDYTPVDVDWGPGPEPIGPICWPVSVRYEVLSDKNFGEFSWFYAGCGVNTVLREFSDEALDLRVKVPGGAVNVQRRFYANAWHWDHERSQLSFEKDPVTLRILAVAKGMVTYRPLAPLTDGQPDSQTVFQNEDYQITVEPEGYLWQDKYGNWERYDLSGRMLSFGLRTGTLATVTYPDSESKRPSGMTDNTGRQVIRFEYDAQGNLAAAQDAQGRRVLYRYTGALLTGVTDPIGGQSAYEYDGTGRITRKIDPAGRPTIIGYDSYGSIASVLGEDGTGSYFEYSYDERTKERYAQVKTSAGKITEVWYDSEDDVKRVDVNGRTFRTVEKDGRTRITTDEKGNVTREERDEWANPTRIVYPDGSQVLFEYDNRFHLVKRAVDLRGYVNTYAYDDHGNLTRKVEALGTADERATRFAYDDTNQLLEITLEGDAQTQEAITRLSYDAAGNIAGITDPEGNRTEFPNYDVMGNLLRMRDPRGYEWTFQYDTLGRLVSKTDPEGNETGYEFDGGNNPTAIIDAYAKRFGFAFNDRNQITGSVDPYGQEARIDYNSDGLPVLLTDAAGKTIGHEYDNEERLLRTLVGPAATGYETRFGYNDTTATFAAASLPVQIEYPSYSTRLYYDRLQRPVRSTDVLDEDSLQSATVEYDVAGNVIARTDEEGRTTQYAYDALSRVIESRDPAGGFTTYAYDDRGNILSVTDPNSGVARLEYSHNGQLTAVIKPLGETTSFKYDAAGNRTAASDARGQRVAYEYSPANRLNRESHFETTESATPVTVVDYSYDKLGRMTGYDDGTTSATYTYDDLDRKTGAAVDYGAFTLDYAYTYYPNGLKESFTGPDGVTYRYHYDDANRLSAIEFSDGQRITYNTYQWNSPTRMTLPGGMTIDYGYDPLQRLTGLDSADRLGAPILSRRYTRSAIGNLGSAVTEHGNYNFQYDALARLTEVDHPLLADEGYTYDALGNRLTAAGIDGAWSYDANNRLLGYGDRSIEYDDNGNQTRGYLGATPIRFVYDLKDRLVRIEREDGSVIGEYYYNPFGRRLWKDVNGVRTYYAYADEGLIGEYDEQGTQTRAYGYRPDSLWTTNPLFQKVGANTYWYQNDHLGTPQRLVDSSGTNVWAAVHTAFGQAQVSLAQVQNNLRFAGQYFDAESGLHYNWHRYYDPQSGRYLTTDPLNEGLNPYLYALNNPLSVIDPEGTHALGVIGGTTEAVVGCMAAWTGIGLVGCIHGIDVVQANLRSLATGENVDTIFSMGLQELGLPRWAANFSDAALSIGTSYANVRTLSAPTTKVTSWAEEGIKPDLNSGRWVVRGDPTRTNFYATGLPGPKGYLQQQAPWIKIESSRVPFENFTTNSVPTSSVGWPTGAEAWKGIWPFSQARIK